MAGLFQDEEVTRTFLHELEGFKKSERFYTEGCALLESALEGVPANKKDNARRILGVAQFILHTYRTVVHMKEFYLRKEQLLESHGDKRNALVDEMLEICRSEYKNAEDTVQYVEFDSALGYEASMEYMCDPAHIEWKLNLLRDVIDRELPSYYEK